MTNETDTFTGLVPKEITGREPAGRFTHIDGEPFYCIHHYDQLEPFLMSIVSDSDHWMFISSCGGLTAGRGNPDQGLFPYDSEDKLHQCHTHTGPRTAIWVSHPERGETLWEPFTQTTNDVYRVHRHLYKSELGNALIFEEINQDLDLTFRYRWCYSEAFGIVRRATLANSGDEVVNVTLLDGLLNVLPYGVTQQIHQHRHCLADAYKHCVADVPTGLGIYAFSSMITDKPEPGETMLATSVWSRGLPSPTVLLRTDRVEDFRARRPISVETVLKGRKAAYLLKAPLQIDPGQLRRWYIVADVAQDQGRVARLRKRLNTDTQIENALWEDVRAGDDRLRRNVAAADGLQTSGNQMMRAHHFANVLFNNMRGGVFDRHYDVGRDNLRAFVRSRHCGVADRCASFFDGLAETAPVREVIAAAEGVGDADLVRLCYEYLPIYFSRRHGDPSRPWNQFDIRVRDENGNRLLAYQGNWRDIFQNWEALCQSYPGFLPSIIAKFVNASTADGFNPYRITDAGIDWEVVDEDDPWSNIGYWGDHQIIYLLKLLESLGKHDPGELARMMTREVFTYADVPYEIKPYEQILKDPHDTIVFNHEKHKRILGRVGEIGADARLLFNKDGGVRHVGLAEKLLVPALSKLSNMVVDGGIWLNTQRPEWNDANNALVGDGLSVVTLCYLRRYLAFCRELFAGVEDPSLRITDEVADWLSGISKALAAGRGVLAEEKVSDTERRRLLDALGRVFCDYRCKLYRDGLGDKRAVPVSEITEMFDAALCYVDHGIRANKREDGMYHAYNLLSLSAEGDTASVSYLYEMLEGQVAVLSSGLLSTAEALEVLDVMPASRLYREDQNSYMLYPNRELPGFLEKNVAPADRVEACELLTKLIGQGDRRLMYRDDEGSYRFAAAVPTHQALNKVIDELKGEDAWRELAERDAGRVSQLFEQVYNHKAFTGRSGGMYGYEGLGCIYWHMVAKLLLATQECYERAVAEGAGAEVVDRLAEAYYRVRSGLGFNKTPVVYGAFPSDPYSHTPGFGGARQPGMTGQVKEEVLTRRGELGVQVERGAIIFRPLLVKDEEYLKIESAFKYYAVSGRAEVLELPEGSIAFTLCQVPVIYHRYGGGPALSVLYSDGKTARFEGDELPADVSRHLFDRTGEVERVDVTIG